MNKYLVWALSLIVVSGLMVWLPSTNTLLDPWRVIMSFALGVIGVGLLIPAIDE